VAIRNVHERTIEAPADEVGALLDAVGRDGDRLWPSPPWVPMRLDGPVAVGAAGGHGPVRYRVTEHEPGRRVRFAFDPKLGLMGYHELTVEPAGGGRCMVRHVLAGEATGSMRVLWPLAVRWLHDAVLEDLLDNAERETTGTVASPARWSGWVRFLWRRLEHPWPRRAPMPEGSLVVDALARMDRWDAWRVPSAGVQADARRWADAIFGDPPGWVAVLLRVRNALVGLVGIDRADASVFAVIAERDGEVLVGADERHLSFRASVLVEERSVTVTTVVEEHNRRGRLYMTVVWPVHAVVVRAMVRRAQRRLLEPEAGSGNPRGAHVPWDDRGER